MSAIAQKQPLRERLAGQHVLFGLLQSRPDPTFIELAGFSGYDFVLLDAEHGVFSERDHLHLLRVITGAGLLAMVRIGGHDLHAVGRFMDFGADVIVVPNVSSADEARALARAMVYPPQGTRGLAPSLHRAARYGLALAGHLEAPRKSVSLLVVLESTRGTASAEEILAVDGVDGALIGPADLAADLGSIGNFSLPELAQAMTRIERAAAAQDKVLGTVPHPPYPADALIARGHRLLVLGSDVSLMREAMRVQLERAAASRRTLERP